MITMHALLALEENDRLTLKHSEAITSKSGWQVATEGVECVTPEDAMNAIKAYDGTCGVWYAGGIYYIDKSHRVNTKHEAMEIGKACHQISVLNWKTMGLAYC